jgi:signal peptidase I
MTGLPTPSGTTRPLVRRLLRLAYWGVSFAMLGAALTVTVARLALHVDAAAVLSDSMRPTFAAGDAVLTRSVPVEDIRPGMVVLAAPPGAAGTYAHRVVSVVTDGGAVIVRTKGDANPAPDAWQDVFTQPTVPRVIGSAPKLGYLIELVRGRTTQRAALPVAVAGVLATVVACALILCAGSKPRSAVTA